MKYTYSLFYSSCLVLVLLGGAVRTYADQTFPVASLDITQVKQSSGDPQANQSADGHPLSIGGRTFTNGLGTLAASQFVIGLNGRAQSFSALAGVDDEVGNGKGSVVFKAVADGQTLWESKAMHGGDAAAPVSIPLKGVKQLCLLAEGGRSGFDHADWADANIVMSGGLPHAVTTLTEEAVILTPKTSPRPHINSAKAFGVRPGAPFLYTIAATGDRPMTFATDGLPPGLQLDPSTGQISGGLKEKGVLPDFSGDF